MKDHNCLFCKIVAGEEASEKIWENDEFLCIKNKYPAAPIHVLVMPKAHIRKQEVISGLQNGKFWGKMMSAVFSVVAQLGLDKTVPAGRQAGYKLVNNGAGYNHFEHEHFHVLGGSKTEPGGKT